MAETSFSVQVVESLPADEIFKRAQAVGLAWSPIRRPEDNLGDAHFAARGSFATIEHPELGVSFRYPGPFVRFSETPIEYRRRPPTVGEHNREVYLNELGLSETKLRDLTGRGVI